MIMDRFNLDGIENDLLIDFFARNAGGVEHSFILSRAHWHNTLDHKWFRLLSYKNPSKVEA